MLTNATPREHSFYNNSLMYLVPKSAAMARLSNTVYT